MENRYTTTGTADANVLDTNISTDSIRKLIDDPNRNEIAFHPVINQQILDYLRALPTKSYDGAALSDNSSAILGDVYQFFSSDSNKERDEILQKRIDELHQRQDARDVQIVHLLELLSKSKTLTTNNDDENKSNVNALINNLRVDRCPRAILRECEAIAIARQFLPDQCIDTNSFLIDLESWARSRTSGLFLIQANPLTEDATKDVAVKITRHLAEAALPVVWWFSDPQTASTNDFCSLPTVLHSLALQLMDLNSGCPTSSYVIRALANEQQQQHPPIQEEDLIDLFRKIVTKTFRVILIIETFSKNDAILRRKGYAKTLVDIFDNLVQEAHCQGRALKILMVHQDPSIGADQQPNGISTNTRHTYIHATPMPLARARVQTMRFQNDLLSVLQNVVLTPGEQVS